MHLCRRYSIQLHCHNGRDDVSNYQPHYCLLNCLSGADQSKNQSSESQAFMMGIRQWPVNSPHKGPVTRKNVSIWWRHQGMKSWELSKMTTHFADDIFKHNFLIEKRFTSIQSSLNFVPRWSVGSNSPLVQLMARVVMELAIIWTNVDRYLCHHMASLDCR